MRSTVEGRVMNEMILASKHRDGGGVEPAGAALNDASGEVPDEVDEVVDETHHHGQCGCSQERKRSACRVLLRLHRGTRTTRREGTGPSRGSRSGGMEKCTHRGSGAPTGSGSGSGSGARLRSWPGESSFSDFGLSNAGGPRWALRGPHPSRRCHVAAKRARRSLEVATGKPLTAEPAKERLPRRVAMG